MRSLPLITLFAAAILVGATAAIAPPGPEFGKRLETQPVGTGPAMDVAIADDHLYAIGGGRLVVLAGAREPKPRIVGELQGLGHVRQIAVSDGHAFITSREDGLYIVDVRQPVQPRLVAHYDTVELATGIAVAGQIAAVANRFAGVELLDVSVPSQPRHLATVRVGEAQSVAFHGPWLYAGVWGTRELAVIDVRDPRHPRLVKSMPLDGYGDGVDIQGHLLAVATGHHATSKQSPKSGDAAWGHGHGVEFFDISDPAAPRWLSRLKLPPFYLIGMDMWGVVLAGDHAFVNDTHNGFFLLDLHDPTQPRCIAYRQLPSDRKSGEPSPAAGLAVAGGVAFVAGASDDVHRIDTGLADAEPAPVPPLQAPPAPPEAPSSGAVYRTSGQVHAVLPWRDDLLLAACGTAGLHVVRLRGDALEPVAHYPTRGFARDVAIHEDRVLVAESQGGLSIWQARADATIDRIGSYEVPGNSIHQVVLADHGRVAFLAVGAGRLQAVRLSGDGKAERILEDQHFGLFYSLPFSPSAKADSRILAQWHVTGLYEYAAENGTAKYTGFNYPHRFGTGAGAVSWRDGWLAISRNGYFFIRPGQTAPPEELGLTQVPDQPLVGKPSASGDTLFVADAFAGRVVALDLSSPTSPRLLATLQTEGHPGFVRVHHGKALIPAGNDGLIVWDWTKDTQK